jgi:RHS repeat-associated protein
MRSKFLGSRYGARGREASTRRGPLLSPKLKPVATVAASAFATLALLTGAFAGVSDPFGGLPSVNTTSPKGADFNDGDHGVDEERGAATYSYPIAVPPGRSGMQPSLSLTYSSQAQLRGGIAVGWTLFNFPMVEVDRSRDTAELHYAVNGSRLIEVDDIKGSAAAVYRVAYDASFTRWERLHDVDSGDFWIARSLDGSRMEFKKNVGGRQWRLTSQVDVYGNRVDYDWGARVALWDGAPTGTPHYLAYELKQILYTGNENTQIAPFARVTFSYSDPPRQDGSWIPPGAQLLWQDGPTLSNTGDATGVVMGSRRLDAIQTSVRDASASGGWRDVQTTALTYETSDPARGAQVRYLKYIDVSAKAPCPYGTTCTPQVTTAPRLTFSYGRYDRRWDAKRDVDIPAGESLPIDSGHSGQAAGATTGFLDINGDGLRDFVRIAPVRNKENTKSICTLIWRQGLGDGRFGPEAWNQQISIPTQDWLNKWDPTEPGAPSVPPPNANSPSLGFDIGTFEAVQERCTLTGQYALEHKNIDLGPLQCHSDFLKILGYHFGDYDNDGVLDIVTTPWQAYALGYVDHSNVLPLPPPPTGDGSCDPPCGEFSSCHGGVCVLNNPDPPQGGTPPGRPPGTPPSPPDTPGPGPFEPPVHGGFDPETCAEWAQLEPRHTTYGTHTDFNQWGLLRYNDNNHAFEGSHTIQSLLPLPPPGQEGLLQATQGTAPFTLQTLEDIDGDGFLDVLATPRDPESNVDEEWRAERQDLGLATFLRVGYGDGGGYFDPALFPKVQNGLLATSSGLFPHWDQRPAAADIYTNATLADMNGDGLKDLVVRGQAGALTYFPNTGKRFAANAVSFVHSVPTSKTHIDVGGWSDALHPDSGVRLSMTQLFDVDEDGRSDLVEVQGSSVKVRYNLADGFSNQYTLPSQWMAVARSGIMEHGDWKTITDVTDVDGDGLPDLQSWTSFTQVPPGGGANFVDPTPSRRLTWFTDDYGTSPPRLLRTVDNGRGSTTEYQYQPSSKLPGAGTLKPTFVVTKVTSTPDRLGMSPQMSTEYSYSKPKYGGHIVVDPHLLSTTGDDEVKALQFQGFQEIEVKGSAPNGQGHGTDVVKTYDYHVDGRGYVTQSRSYIWDNGSVSRRLLSVDYHTWVDEGLFDNRVSFVRAGLSDTRICLSADETACLGDHSEDNFAFSFSVTTPRAVLVGGKRAFLIPDTSSSATSDHIGEQRLTRTFYDVLYGVNGAGFDYRILPKETKTEHQVGLGPSAAVTVTSRQVTIYDANHFPTRTQQWYGPAETEYVASERTFETSTGLVLTTKRPEQVRQGSNGRSASYTYDANKIFAEVEINELGYGAHTYYDAGTGTAVHKTGPNMVLVYNSSTCTSMGCPQSFQTEESTSTIDGFGRVIAMATTYQLGDTLTGAPMVTLSTSTYDDVNNTTISRSLIDPAEVAARWTTTRSVADGLGRTLSSTTCTTAGSSAVDASCLTAGSNATVSYAYDGAGLMVSTTMPSPASDAATVTYAFAHDAVGRETLMTRPDGSAMSTSYGPLSRKVLETGTITGGGSTVIRSDVDGNVAEVLECLASPCDDMPGEGPADARWSSTRYSYDDFARLVSVLDAEWKETAMEHDLLGRRTKITRGTRIWGYGYDHDGNLTAETSPMPAGESDPAKYTSTSSYDVLDRISGHMPAARDATDGELTAEWAVPFAFAYDVGSNAVGRLVSVSQAAYTPIGAGHVYYYRAEYGYDGMGRVKRESRLMNPTGGVGAGLTQSLSTTYNALGSATQSVWDDGQTVSTTYDDRGLTKTVNFSGGGNVGINVLADYGTRNLAGLPLKRSTSQTFAKLSRSWTYDSSGHIATDLIQRPALLTGAPFVQAQRTYAYLPTGELLSVVGKTRLVGLDTATGFQDLNETYEYDTTHRLKHAHEASTNYDLVLTYDRVGNILTAKASGLPSGTGPNQNRDVAYHYDWLDPQAVDKLIDNHTGQPVATMAYTPMGEMSSRQWPLGSDQEMKWDGDGRLRQVHTADGTIERYAYDQNGQRIWAVKENAVDAGTRFWFGPSETYVPAASPTDTKRLIYISDGGGALGRTERTGTGVAYVELSFADTQQNVFLTAKSAPTKPDGGAIPNAIVAVTSWMHYGAFGEVITQGGQDSHRRQFNGKEADSATGLRYYGARYYDPLLLRWNSSDPLYRFAPDVDLLNPQRQNLYSFTANNPVRLVDPDGRAVGAIIGVVACPECAVAVAVIAGVYLIAVQLDQINSRDGESGAVFDSDAPLVLESAGSPGAINERLETPKVYTYENATASHAEARGNRIQSKPLEGKPKPAGKPAGKAGPPSGKKVPSPDGKKGGPAHQKGVDKVEKDIQDRGNVAQREARVKTPNGEKGSRYADVAEKTPDGKVVQYHQVGKQTQAGNPVAREQRAIDDIQGAPEGGPVTFHPYNEVTK